MPVMLSSAARPETGPGDSPAAPPQAAPPLDPVHDAGPAPAAGRPGRIGFGEVLRLWQAGADLYRGVPHEGRPPRAFGGVTLAQALLAASRTLEPADPGTAGPVPHSLHAYFLHSVTPGEPVEHRVERLRDGSSYASRQVLVQQEGRPVVSLTASFKRTETALDRQAEAPAAPDPDSLPDPQARFAERHPAAYAATTIARVLDLRPVPPDAEDLAAREAGRARQRVWMRAALPLPDVAEQPVLHAAVLAYLSDLTLTPTAALPWESLGRGAGPGGQRLLLASLDHALWFHRPHPADDWLLYDQRTITLADGRALSRGELWSRDGALIATATQEAVLRLRSGRS